MREPYKVFTRSHFEGEIPIDRPCTSFSVDTGELKLLVHLYPDLIYIYINIYITTIVWLVVAGTTLFTLGFKTAKKGQPLFWFSLKPRLCMLTSHICHHFLAAAGFDSINQPVCTILGPANLFAWVPWLTVAGWACGWNGEICQRGINKPELPTKIVMNHHWNWYTPSHKPGVPVLCRKIDDQPRL